MGSRSLRPGEHPVLKSHSRRAYDHRVDLPVRSVLVVGAVDSETGSPLDNLTIAVNLVEEDRTTAVATVTNTTGFNTTIDVPRNRQFIVTVSRFGFASSSSIVRSSQADIVDVDFFLIRRPADGRLQR
eukprot:m.119892 g.119892  ORF g.119892 m.119892 type:complete len:128 (+) comp37710_c0_seq38:1020-1403(+)